MSNGPAPAAPGRLGTAIGIPDLLKYLEEMESWLSERRRELDRLDAAAQASPTPGTYTGDIMLAFSLWQAIRNRTDELVAVWDSGRADAVGRERMSQLIWGRLDSHAGAATLSMVEAATLCDALAVQLRSQLEFDPQAAGTIARIRALRSAIVRSEDLTDGDFPLVSALRTRLDALAARAERGGDITGPLGELETETAQAERDLIVKAAGKRETRKVARAAEQTVAVLSAREPVLRELAARCRAQTANPPKLAIPRVAALGPVPQYSEPLQAFAAKLRTVARALDAVEEAYSTPLRERAQLRFRLGQARAAAQANGRAATPTVQAADVEATTAVEATPCDVLVARFLVEQYEYLSHDMSTWSQRGNR